MSKSVKMCDMSAMIAAKVFKMLNGDSVHLKESFGRVKIVTDVEPKDLVYPEGWYYAKGTFRNKHMSSTGFYDEVRMEKSSGQSWDEIANYCTLD